LSEASWAKTIEGAGGQRGTARRTSFSGDHFKLGLHLDKKQRRAEITKKAKG